MSNHQHLQSRGGEAAPNFKTQQLHILDLLMVAGGSEVPLAEIMVCAAQYNRCIYNLRKGGYKIMNRAETRNGVRHSWYRLESSPADVTPRTPEPAPSRKISGRVEPPSTSLPPSELRQTLSLFPDLPETPAPAVSSQHPVWRDPEMDAVKKGRVKHG
jgi:hypothetical protein